MDTKKKMIRSVFLTILMLLAVLTPMSAQTVTDIQMGGVDYSYSSDTLSLKFNIVGADGQHLRHVRPSDLYEHLEISMSGQTIADGEYSSHTGGILIPKENTISVLIDRGISPRDKEQIFESVRNLVASAPDSCIYISFFDENVTETMAVTPGTYNDFRSELMREGGKKYFFGALYSKLLEFDASKTDTHPEYRYNRDIARRAGKNPDKNAMFIFVDGSRMADINDPVQYLDITQGASDLKVKPRIYAFYYTTGTNFDEDVELTLSGLTGNSVSMAFPKGKYVSAEDEALILREVGKAIEDQKYDYSFTFRVTDRTFVGNTPFVAKWDGLTAGEAEYTIGNPENPWPQVQGDTADYFLQIMMALLVTLLTILFFMLIMKVVVPFIKSKSFSMKYYKRYEPEDGVNKRLCAYCKQPLHPGEIIVNKCKHLIHVRCWQDNDYRCAEYGQNCTTGIQEHVDWKNIFSRESLRDSKQTISGILAGFVSWIVYELIGRGIFPGLASSIADMFITDESKRMALLEACTTKLESFFSIGIILGFFLSAVFRFNDEYRKKNFNIWMKIFGFSLLSSFIGFLAFVFGGVILCMLVSMISAPGIPWYCSLPAYILFSVCVSLSLTIKTSIPIKSAMLGGLCSALIGFIVLYCTSNTSHPWLTMLLDFVIYGGGLGASLVTVRMLAEKYFLVIQNGPRKGVRIPIHKWMNAVGGGNKVTIGMTGDCEIQMNWEKSNKVAKEHVVLYIDRAKSLPMINPQAPNVLYNSRVDLPVRKPAPLSNGDTFKIGDTIFLYEETD